MRIAYEQVVSRLERVLTLHGFSVERARLCAQTFADNNRDGVHSHGLRRFGGFVESIATGQVDPQAELVRTQVLGVIERWDARLCPGPIAARQAMARAMAIAHEHGMGCVGLSNTGHWLRGGTYGLQAAEAGFMAMCWTNAWPMMAPWGATEPKLGNNPLVIAVPRKDGPIVLDMAMTQFSAGRLGVHSSRGEMLPVPGGYDNAGNLTCDPAAIRESGRPLPVGYWKGTGLALMLDLMASVISGGRTTCDIGRDGQERAVSQVFIAIDASRLGGEDKIEAIITDLLEAGEAVRYPSQRAMRDRAESDRLGLEIDDKVWNDVCAMENG